MVLGVWGWGPVGLGVCGLGGGCWGRCGAGVGGGRVGVGRGKQDPKVDVAASETQSVPINNQGPDNTPGKANSRPLNQNVPQFKAHRPVV